MSSNDTYTVKHPFPLTSEHEIFGDLNDTPHYVTAYEVARQAASELMSRDLRVGQEVFLSIFEDTLARRRAVDVLLAEHRLREAEKAEEALKAAKGAEEALRAAKDADEALTREGSEE